MQFFYFSIFWSLSLIISKILKFDHATTWIMIDQKKGEGKVKKIVHF